MNNELKHGDLFELDQHGIPALHMFYETDKKYSVNVLEDGIYVYIKTYFTEYGGKYIQLLDSKIRLLNVRITAKADEQYFYKSILPVV